MAKRDSTLPWLLVGIGVAVVAMSSNAKAPPIPPGVSARRPGPGTRDFDMGRANARTEHFGTRPAPGQSTLRTVGQKLLAITPPGVFNMVVNGVEDDGDEYLLDEFEYDYDRGEYLPLDDDGDEFARFIDDETSAYDDRVNRVNPFEVVRAGPGFSVDSMLYGGS